MDRQSLLDLQKQINKLPLHKLGALLGAASTSKELSDVEKDLFLKQILFAMEPANDNRRG